MLNIVLVEPEIPQNTGNIGRTCAILGAKLHLVEPMGFMIQDKYIKRAGMDYWQKIDITKYDDINDFFEKNKGGTFYYASTKAPQNYCDIEYPDNCYILFGKESAGLDEELLHNNKDHCIRIPMRKDFRSLNLGNSVAVIAYEIMRQWDFKGLNEQGNLTKFDWQE